MPRTGSRSSTWSTGDPPITNEDERRSGWSSTARSTTSVQLREELRSDGPHLPQPGRHRGHRPPRRGHDAVALARELDGMFAFAVWDRERGAADPRPRPRWARSRSTTGARRRRSCSPARSRACSPTPRVPCELDERAISAYLTFGYVPTPGHLLRGIRSLPPGARADARAGRRAARSSATGSCRSPGMATAEHALDIGLEEAAAEVRRAARRRRSAGGWSPTCRSAPFSAAGSTRARSSP